MMRAPHACARGAHAAGSAAVGLAATVRAPASRHLLPWVRHHTQRLGVACVFLFWDAPKDAQMRLLALEPGVFVIGESGLGAARGSAAHPWARMPSYAALSGGDAAPLEQNQLGMQRLNAEVALELAAGAGLEWLLPINAEEALYVDPDALAAARPSLLNALLPEDSSDECAQWVADAKDGCGGDHPAKDAVRVLGATRLSMACPTTCAASVGQIVLPTREGVPEAEEAEPWISSVSLYRRNPSELSSLSATQQADATRLRQKTRGSTLRSPRGGFLLYDTGKALVRVGAAAAEGLRSELGDRRAQGHRLVRRPRLARVGWLRLVLEPEPVRDGRRVGPALHRLGVGRALPLM